MEMSEITIKLDQREAALANALPFVGTLAGYQSL
jgi:hypothetical protein